MCLNIPVSGYYLKIFRPLSPLPIPLFPIPYPQATEKLRFSLNIKHMVELIHISIFTDTKIYLPKSWCFIVIMTYVDLVFFYKWTMRVKDICYNVIVLKLKKKEKKMCIKMSSTDLVVLKTADTRLALFFITA